MTLPQIFAHVPTNTRVAGAQLDRDLNQIGTMGVYPSIASGGTTIALVPFPNLPTLSAYADYQRFSFVATATSTGPVTVNFAGLGALPWYAADGVTQLDAGQVALGEYYDIVFIQALNSGGGGFISAAASSAPSGPVGPHSIALSNIVQAPAQIFLGNPNTISADLEFMDVPTSRLLMLGDATPSLIGGPGISITGVWPDQTVNFTGVPPDFANGALNVEGLIDADGTILQGLNIASVTALGGGLYTVVFTIPFASINYAAIAGGVKSPLTGASFISACIESQTASQCQVSTVKGLGSSPSSTNARFSLMCSGVSSNPVYQAGAVNFNNPTGSTAATVYLTNGAALTGVADSSVGVFSVWVKQQVAVTASTRMMMLMGFADGTMSAQPTFYGLLANASQAELSGWGETLTPDTNFETGNSPVGSLTIGTWTNILMSWDMNAAAGARTVQIYLNGLASTFAPDTDSGIAFQVPYSTIPNWVVGAFAFDNPATDIEAGFVGDMADLQFYPGVTLDLSSLPNRELFILAGKPVSPTVAIGALGTPALLFSGNTSTFPINQGSGGAFTLTGSLPNASTSPSD